MEESWMSQRVPERESGTGPPERPPGAYIPFINILNHLIPRILGAGTASKGGRWRPHAPARLEQDLTDSFPIREPA
jgi:hypothetical protein